MICVVFYTLLVFLAIQLAGSKLIIKIITIFILLLLFNCILHAGIDAAVIGLALTYSTTLTGLFQYCIRGSAEVENLVCKVIL